MKGTEKFLNHSKNFHNLKRFLQMPIISNNLGLGPLQKNLVENVKQFYANRQKLNKKNLLNNFQQNKENINHIPNPQPSIAPYPPLRQTHPTLTLPVRTSEPLINVFQSDSLTSSYRVPPSLNGRRITIVNNGKKQDIVFLPGNKNTDNEDPRV